MYFEKSESNSCLSFETDLGLPLEARVRPLVARLSALRLYGSFLRLKPFLGVNEGTSTTGSMLFS